MQVETDELNRQRRKQELEIDRIRTKLERSENSGYTNETKEQILQHSKSLFFTTFKLKQT